MQQKELSSGIVTKNSFSNVGNSFFPSASMKDILNVFFPASLLSNRNFNTRVLEYTMGTFVAVIISKAPRMFKLFLISIFAAWHRVKSNTFISILS